MATGARTPALIVTAALAAGGLGLWGGTGPADAVSGTLTYHCTNNVTADEYDFTAVIDTDAPATLGSGVTAPITVTSDVTVPEGLVTSLRDTYHAAYVSGSSQTTGTVDGVNRTATLTIPNTNVPASGTMHVVGKGPGGNITGGNAGTSILIGAAGFTATLVGYTNTGAIATPPTTFTCALNPAPPAQNVLVDTVNVVPAATTIVVTVQPSPVEYGAVPSVSADVSRVGSNAKPDGTIAFSYAGKTVTTAVKGGKAKADLPAALTMGANHVTATFTPTDKNLAVSTANASFTVVRGSTTTTGAAVYRAARHRFVAKAKVVSVNGTEVTGSVKFVLKRDGVKIRRAKVTLNAFDKAKRVFQHIGKPGSYTLVARYLGSSTLTRSVDKVQVTV